MELSAQSGVPANGVPVRRSRPSPAAGGVNPTPAFDIEKAKRTEKVGTLVMSARLALRRGRREEARAMLKEAFALEATDAAALELLGDVFLEEGEQEKAMKVFERGKSYHPQNTAFEEKIALCLIDINEVRHNRELQKQFLEQGDKDRWMDRKPQLGFGLSLIVPGAGQFYNDENERGFVFIGLWILTFCGWFYPLANGLQRVVSPQGRGIDVGRAISAMSSGLQLWFWFMFAVWTVTIVLAAVDGMLGAERANRERRRVYGV